MKILLPIGLLALAILLFTFNPWVWAEEPAPSSKTLGTTKELMGKFLSHMQALKGYIVSEDQFIDKKNFGVLWICIFKGQHKVQISI